MSDTDNPELGIPTEIPWQLAATTQKLGPETLASDTTAISIFSYVPSLESLDADYPDDRLIYFKFIVSVSPIFLAGGPKSPADPLNLFSADPNPIWRLIFDVRIAPEPYAAGVSKPYFLSAAPIRRAMVETGVVGQQATEGEAKSLAIGKSGSQMHEGYASTVDTSTNSAGVSWPFGGVSSNDTSTTVAGTRDVVQRIDTTQRNASSERQELVSHMTNVTNILTLLSAYDVGSPYLRFSLWTRPLQPLVIDPADPNLWYAELLRRRSSGIEGIQEFFAVAVVPRSLKGFCIETQLRRFSAVPPPLPTGKQLEMPGNSLIPTDEQVAILEDYLENRYPMGTPVDELDVEPVPYLPKNPQINRPVVVQFLILSEGGITDEIVTVTTLDVVDEPTAGGGYAGLYKSAVEVWLDMKNDEYEKELIKSPLANGLLYFKNLKLTTCFGPPFPPLAVVATNVVSPKRPSFLDLNARPAGSRRPAERKPDLYRQALLAWNAAESQLGNTISHATELPESDFRLDHPTAVDFALRRLSAMDTNDPANQSLQDAAMLFALTPEQIESLVRHGITDLRGLANAIILAPVIDRINRRRAAPAVPPTARPGRRPPIQLPSQPLRVVFSIEAANRLRKVFGERLQALADETWNVPDEGEPK